MENEYIKEDKCIERYLATMQRQGYKIAVSEDKITFKKDNKIDIIFFKSKQELERNIRLFRRGLPQPVSEDTTDETNS